MGPRGTLKEILVNFGLRNQKHNLYLLIYLEAFLIGFTYWSKDSDIDPTWKL